MSRPALGTLLALSRRVRGLIRRNSMELEARLGLNRIVPTEAVAAMPLSFQSLKARNYRLERLFNGVSRQTCQLLHHYYSMIFA